jgi:hypothetical protein
VRFADLPMIEGATGKFLLQQMAAVAELEAGMNSARTKAALAAAKRRGVKLGGDRGARLTAKARAAGRATLQKQARNRALDLFAPTIQELQATGCESLRAIAAGLEERGIPAARGGKWSAVPRSTALSPMGCVPTPWATGKIEATTGPKGKPGRGHGRGSCGSADRGAHDPIGPTLHGNPLRSGKRPRSLSTRLF